MGTCAAAMQMEHKTSTLGWPGLLCRNASAGGAASKVRVEVSGSMPHWAHGCVSVKCVPFAPRKSQNGANLGEAVMRRALLLFALGMIALPASAHTGEGFAGGFAAGFMHPLSGLDHLLAMAAVGIWGAFLGRPLIWMLPVAFPLVMVVGGVLGIAGIPLPHVEMGIAASVIVLGLAIAAAWRAPVWLAVAIVAVFAIFHGHAHGTELPTAAAPEAYAAGFVISTGLIHLAGIAIGLLGKLPHGSRILRTTGGAIMVTGVWILAGMPGLR